MVKLSSLFTLHCSDALIGHVFFSLCKRWEGPDLYARMVVPSCEKFCRVNNLVEAVPRVFRNLYYRNDELPRKLAEKRFLKDLKAFDAAYLWPGVSRETYRKVKAAQKPIFIERVNCYTGKAKQILDSAYAHLGLQPQHSITPESIQAEKEKVDLADFILCPSLLVKESFQEIGVAEQKLIVTSEGWSPQRFSTTLSEKLASEEITVLFMGYICVRKGAHFLLRAWEKANIKGRLIIMGNIEPAIAETFKDTLSRPDITHIGFRKDYTSVYREANVFALPSLEEGSPLVTYEAMAHGLPIVASPMGAGGIVRDGLDGFIIPSHNEDEWVATLRKLSTSPDLRMQLSVSARQRASEFTWDEVANKRAALMLDKLRVA